jgi:hypothetical protein
MTKTASPIRFAWAAAFSLLLSVRLLGASGYMPAVEHGRLTIVACPDADVNAPLALGSGHRHHHGAKHNHGTCPYAEASALGALPVDFAPLITVLIFSVALLLGRTFLFVQRQRTRERPPAIGPPIPA